MFTTSKKPKAQVRKEIIEFLEKTSGRADPKPGKYSCGMIHRNALVLATSYRDVPRATPLEFFHEGLTIYIFGEPGGKIANIKRNSTVSAAIYEQPLDHRKTQKSLQIFGTATVYTMRNNPRLVKAKSKKWNLYTVIDKFIDAESKNSPVSEKDRKTLYTKIQNAISLIKITPHHIILREYHKDISMPKYEWKK